MSVVFKAENHVYESLDPKDKITWTSVTSVIAKFKQKFDPVAQSIKSSNNKRSKWYGIPPEKIQAIWKSETDRALGSGSFYHDQREADVVELDNMQREGVTIPVIKPIYIDNAKHAPVQRLTEGIYPEHLTYLKSAAVCGQADRIEVVKNHVHVIDYKTNKEIKKKSFVNWEGISQKMLGPCKHLDDCNFNHYALQLSIYMYIILKHNPHYLPGKLVIHHIIFEKESEDEFGYPILKKNEAGENIVKEVIPYDVPYLKEEVINMLNYIKENPNA